MTAIAGQVVASADFNLYVRDNLNLTEAAKALNPSGFFVATGANAIAERIFTTDKVDTQETTTSTTPANLATVGPTVTVTTGTKAIVIQGGRIGPNTNGATASVKMSWAISGATTRAASDDWAAGGVGMGVNGVLYTSRWYLATALTAGSNTFQAKYSVSSGTGTFQFRSLHVLPL
jgi:hypothetical protein